MTEDWKTYKLSDAFEIIGGGTPKTKVKEYWNGDIPWLSVVDFNNDQRTVWNTEKTITELGLQKSSTKLLKKGQLIISARGTVGQIAQLGKDMTFNQSCYGLSGKESILINDYGYYILKHSVSNIQSNAHGSVFDTITRNTFDNIEIVIPPLEEQHAIASILSALDDKIELNLQMNKTLEEMAMALYKHWFVDFGPFQNEKFVDSELGMIPEGWEVKRLEEILEIRRGGSPRPIQAFLAKEGLPWMKISDATASNSPFLYSTKEFIKEEGLRKTVLMKSGSIILSNSATPGLPRLIEFDTCIHDGWLHFPKINRLNRYILYLLFLDIKEHLIQQGNGSVFTNLKTDILKAQLISLPTIGVENSFTNQITPWFEQIRDNTIENQTLTTLRDTLLPKLISGEVRVKDVDKLVHESL